MRALLEGFAARGFARHAGAADRVALEDALDALGAASGTPALLAAKAGATFISPFVGRLDDIATDGMGLIADILKIYRNYSHLKTEVLVASIRHPMHLVEAAKLGAEVATMPPAIIRQLLGHPLTDKGLEAFLADWRKTGQSIL